jgi:hypothetical protein
MTDLLWYIDVLNHMKSIYLLAFDKYTSEFSNLHWFCIRSFHNFQPRVSRFHFHRMKQMLQGFDGCSNSRNRRYTRQQKVTRQFFYVQLTLLNNHASTCFGTVCGPSSGGRMYIQGVFKKRPYSLNSAPTRSERARCWYWAHLASGFDNKLPFFAFRYEHYSSSYIRWTEHVHKLYWQMVLGVLLSGLLAGLSRPDDRPLRSKTSRLPFATYIHSTSWWWATNGPETCRVVVLNKVKINSASCWLIIQILLVHVANDIRHSSSIGSMF